MQITKKKTETNRIMLQNMKNACNFCIHKQRNSNFEGIIKMAKKCVYEIQKKMKKTLFNIKERILTLEILFLFRIFFVYHSMKYV